MQRKAMCAVGRRQPFCKDRLKDEGGEGKDRYQATVQQFLVFFLTHVLQEEVQRRHDQAIPVGARERQI
jgi:hypothetical protein